MRSSPLYLCFFEDLKGTDPLGGGLDDEEPPTLLFFFDGRSASLSLAE